MIPLLLNLINIINFILPGIFVLFPKNKKKEGIGLLIVKVLVFSCNKIYNPLAYVCYVVPNPLQELTHK